MQISPVESRDSLVSSSEVMSESLEPQSGWKTCAWKTGIGSVGGMMVSVRAGGTKGSGEVFRTVVGRLEIGAETMINY